MADNVAELLREFLLALTNLSAIDHYIVMVGNTINMNRPEAKRFETHKQLRRDKTELQVMHEKQGFSALF